NRAFRSMDVTICFTPDSGCRKTEQLPFGMSRIGAVPAYWIMLREDADDDPNAGLSYIFVA
ncbi:MAG: hypothetical protein D6695_09140, partial [Planctomycetota bacterium]